MTLRDVMVKRCCCSEILDTVLFETVSTQSVRVGLYLPGKVEKKQVQVIQLC